MTLARALMIALVLLPVSAVVLAQALPIREGTRSLEVTATGAIVRAAPSTRAARRGTVRVGTRLPVLERTPGDGCPAGSWYRVGPDSFICESLVAPSGEPPRGEPLPMVRVGEVLPRRHAFVAVDGTWAYARPSDYFADDWLESLGQGFGIVITATDTVRGVDFVRSLGGLWVPADELRFARPSDFAGVAIEETLDVAWAARDGVTVRDSRGRSSGRLAARQLVRIRERLGRDRVRVDEGVVAARDLLIPERSTPPSGVGEVELWIDVDRASQTLVAYRGDRAIFATLVSTGRARAATPAGSFRIWVKLAEDTMDDLERTDLSSNYAIEGVPWVQYFAEGVALHAAFWHDDFGRPRSHGCVNLSPRDARTLFEMTEPTLPPGWDAILATSGAPGTLVRVR